MMFQKRDVIFRFELNLGKVAVSAEGMGLASEPPGNHVRNWEGRR